MLKYRDREIVYSFEFGGYSTKKERLIICCSFGLIVLFGVALAIGLGLSFETPYNTRAVFFGVAISVLGLIPIIVVLFLPSKEKRNDKTITEWLKADEILLYKVSPWEYKTDLTNTGALHYKFGIDFEYKDRKITKTSKKSDAFYKKIKGTPIEVLYIPQYDQVLVLKG